MEEKEEKHVEFVGGPLDGQTLPIAVLDDGRLPPVQMVAYAPLEDPARYELVMGVDAEGRDTGVRVYVCKGV